MYLGIDVHKTFNQACLIDELGNKLQEQKFLNTKEELDQFLESIPEDTSVVLEACSVWEPIYDEIKEHGFEIHLAHPLKTKIIGESKIKTDKIDAYKLAQLLRVNLLPEAYVPPEHMRKLRTIIRHRYALVRTRAKIKNMVHSILHKTGNQLELTDIFGKTGMLTMRSKEFNIPSQHKFALTHYLDLIDKINSQIEETNKYIDIQAEQIHEIDVLKSFPGFGTYSAVLLYAEIGEITRFDSYKKLCGYAGLVSSVHQSGERTKYGHITKQGNPFIRWILMQAVLKTANQHNVIQKFYRRMLSKKGNHVAKVATTRKMLVYIYIMLTQNVRFEELRVNSV